MFLEVGNVLCIDDPTPEQIAYHLRKLPADAPFVILNADDEHFIQATPEGDVLRVEWRQRFILVPLDRAEQSFLAFRRWDEPALQAFPWQRLSVFHDPCRRLMIVVFVAVFVLLVFALLNLWSVLR